MEQDARQTIPIRTFFTDMFVLVSSFLLFYYHLFLVVCATFSWPHSAFQFTLNSRTASCFLLTHISLPADRVDISCLNNTCCHQ